MNSFIVCDATAGGQGGRQAKQGGWFCDMTLKWQSAEEKYFCEKHFCEKHWSPKMMMRRENTQILSEGKGENHSIVVGVEVMSS